MGFKKYIFFIALLFNFWSFYGFQNNNSPNYIVIFVDDMGYGDLGVYGNPTISTPHLDKMAYEGQKWTQFYSAASVCTPSRAALLTGRLPVRSGMASSKNPVLFPNSLSGLPANELTLAEKLKEKKYKTAIVGKWHLGHTKNYLPNNSSIFVVGNGDLNGTFPVFTATKKEKTVPVKIVSVERNNATSPEGKFLALREDGKDFEEDTFILQVNSCSQS